MKKIIEAQPENCFVQADVTDLDEDGIDSIVCFKVMKLLQRVLQRNGRVVRFLLLYMISKKMRGQ